jgi:hypothetical protein
MRHFKSMKIGAVALSLATLLTVSALAAPARAQATSQWEFTGSMASGHGNTNLVQLPDGRVLAISGDQGNGVFTPTAEIYDPNTGQWAPAGTLTDARMAFGQPSVLSNGDVLVAGGHDPNVNDFATAELYDNTDQPGIARLTLGRIWGEQSPAGRCRLRRRKTSP